ncbi:DegT/DnrJ/EryC1/StrS family aminotransferase [Flavobacterium sp. TSSA_36]|uniref:DegT/DnrJ/EryC1/StrS family aminotransferase n=1 Tax=Flavobacterium sp. TSSA_36 TaxID=3447669 RepID=UPI003F2B2871
MTQNRIYLSEPHSSGKELRYIEEAIRKNWISSGVGVSDFEDDIQRFLTTKKWVCATNSGTSALHLGLLLLGVQSGDEVLCQTFTFSATVNPIRYIGAIPVFVDSERATWNMCPKALELAIQSRCSLGKKPKAILVVDSYGMPFQADAIRAIATKYEIPILEDSAEAFGSQYKKQPCGTLGDIGVFSFNGNKIITTSSGGALVVASKELRDRAFYLATQAKDAAPYYLHSELGYNYAMSAISAAIGRGQLEVMEERLAARRSHCLFYEKAFAAVDGISVFKEPNADFFSNYWLTVIQIDKEKTNGLTPELFRSFMEKQGIETRLLWKPMHQQPLFCNYPYYGGQVAATLFENGLCLPSSSSLNQEAKNSIQSCISQLLKDYDCIAS